MNMILEKDLENAILLFHHKLMDEMYKKAKQLKLTSSQLEVLHCVGEKGNPTMKEIASSLHITPPSVTNVVESLCKKNYLKREFGKKDRRIVRIVITPKALKLFSSFKNDKDKKDKNKKDEKQKQDKDKENKEKDKKEEQKISKEDAKRLLDALQNDEKNLQDKMKKAKVKGAKTTIEKDW